MKTFKNQNELRKYLQENPDPLGVKQNGGYKEYTMEEIAKHNAPPSIWSVYKGDVYDITMYVDVHPAGKKILEKVYGKDMTALYNKFHGYLRIESFIGPLKIGTVKTTKSSFSQQGNNEMKEEGDEEEDQK